MNAVAKRVAELGATGAAIVVATIDQGGRPVVTRGWGMAGSTDGRITLCVTAVEHSPVSTTLRPGAAVAVTIVDPATYGSAQLKGSLTGVRPPTDEEHGLVDTHVRRFAETMRGFGLADTECLMLGHLVVVELDVREVYDQTPGERAGQLLS